MRNKQPRPGHIAKMIRLPAATLFFISACATNVPVPDQAALSGTIINQNAAYPQSHASTLAETEDGQLIASWFGGLHERHPEVAIYVARYEAGSWLPAVKVASGQGPDGKAMPVWNPVLFQPPGSPLQLFYKVGPNPGEWWGMRMVSYDNGKTWSAPERLPHGIIGPVKNKPVITGMGAWLSPSSTEQNGDWRIHFEYSNDQGNTWHSSDNVGPGPGLDAIQPSILSWPDGRLQSLSRTKQGVLATSWSFDRGKTWSPLSAIDLPNPNSGTDAITLKDGRQLLVYNHAAHLPQTPGKGPRYPLNIALSADGISWHKVLTLESKPVKEGYAYPSVIQSDTGLVHITYTVGRARIRHVVIDPAKLLIPD